MLAVLAERSAAHEQFFRFQEAWQRTAAQVAIASIPAGSESVATADRPTDLAIWSPPAAVPRALDRPACLEFARGQIGNVLGPSFAHVDGYPTRVRLPDEPLMLVDRILQIEGTPQSLGAGRVVTEHDVLPGDWYLDQGRMPTSITVESGQADLFLAGFLGIDDRARGQAVYRLLDAVVTFHAGLPRAGQTVRYDIQIERFFEQGGVYLFRFGFEGTVEGQPLLSMRDGCAGFFTPEALAAGRGLVAPATPQPPRPGRGLAAGEWFHEPPAVLDGTQVNAIYAGDLAGGLGPAFASLPQFRPLVPPGSRLKLVDRVTHQSRSGGRFGNGLVRAEAAVPPDAWYLTCHFVDDQVMPGTLMYECCLHTLRLYLLSLGWVGSEAGESWAEPVPGVASRLKCRGQVTSATRLVEYEVHIREIGLEPEAYAVGDAVMFADGKPIVEIGDLSLRLQGVTRGELDRFWAKTRVGSHAMSFPPSSSEAWPAARSSEPSRRPALFDRERILAFAVGKPSEAFGPPYAVFDQERVIARLPGPPYQFLDRIVAIEGEPWQMRAGGVVEAEYDVPADAWYLAANRQPAMPFAVLLEVALQPCGWLAAYVGSALTSPVDLSFRNLGGSALVSREVTAASGTLTTRVKLTNVSASGGMIIQHYDFAVRSSEGAVLEGQTYFGFFTKAALAQQVGLRDAQLAEVTPGPGWPMPRQAPFPDDRLRMIETMDTLDTAQGGQYGLGLAAGHKRVDPNEWFFAAHFHQDPVQPGSLGLEGFLQLVKAWAATRWRVQARSRFVTPVPSHRFEWTYRGQVVPGHGVVQVQASPQAVDDERRLVTAAGVLSVDGRPIYAMSGFTLQVCD
ncbi:MAG TPA: hypothetical protein PKC45_01660 [Gemmatales bacterium]|nr:hypothetical protein [Gemmatales bacterium]